MNIPNFLSLLKQQTSVPKASEDSKIMEKINKWRLKQTPSYKSFIKKGGDDLHYLANMFARAGVDKNDAKTFISTLDDISATDIDKTLDEEYSLTPPEEDLRYKLLTFR